MKTYNVKEIAELLNTSEETVRRWIRSGKLQATQDSRKTGNIVTEKMLGEFAKRTPKYAFALGMPVVGAAVSAAAILALITGEVVINEGIKNSKVSSDEVDRILKEKIVEAQKNIKVKEKSIEQLRREIKSEEETINSMKYLLKELSNGTKEGIDERDN